MALLQRNSLPSAFFSTHTRLLTRPRTVAVRASADRRDRRQRRLIPFILSLPKRVDVYFERYPARRVLWGFISCGAGFYAGNVVTLSFGALAVNDVLAAVVTLFFYEAVSRAFYGSENPSLRLWFANFFKIGVVSALFADALKLGS